MAQRQRWEYGAVIIELFPSSGDGGKLNQWGKDGWELITIISSADENGRMCMRRSLSGPC
jgi:hypothetical protein